LIAAAQPTLCASPSKPVGRTLSGLDNRPAEGGQRHVVALTELDSQLAYILGDNRSRFREQDCRIRSQPSSAVVVWGQANQHVAKVLVAGVVAELVDEPSAKGRQGSIPQSLGSPVPHGPEPRRSARHSLLIRWRRPLATF